VIRTLLVLLTFAGGNVHASEDSQSWDFAVFLDDQAIGSHRFHLSPNGNSAVLQSEARFDVKVWFVPVFSYWHRNTETWADGCLHSIEATTDNNGETLEVKGKAMDGGFVVGNRDGEADLSGCVMTFAYWNPAILGAERLLNAQTGVYENISVTLEGEEILKIEDRPVATERFRLRAQSGDIILWYSKAERHWVGLSAPAKGQRRLNYLASRIPELSESITLAAAGSPSDGY
jgi:hypothetical protein